MAGDWNFLAGRLDGTGGIEIIESDLPIAVTSLSVNLSAPSQISGSITNEVKRLKVNGRPIFEPSNTVLLAERDDNLRGMGIYRTPSFRGPTWSIDVTGLSSYARDMPYIGSASFVETDPLVIFRHIWSHLQGHPGGNLGITVDTLTSPVQVGKPIPAEPESTQDGPYTLATWETPDLSKSIDDLSRLAPFDWLERIYWDGPLARCHIDLGYPVIGQRVDHHRLVLGENLATPPSANQDDLVNQVYVLGAGEGPDRVQGYAGVYDGRVRVARTITDTSIQYDQDANARARDELAARRGGMTVETLEIFDHPNAPLAALELGSEVQLFAETDWYDLDTYVRVVGKTESPTRDDKAMITVVRGGTTA